MAIQYDANDFRNAADYVQTYDVFEDRDREIAVLLRQAADMMERERRYEYAVKVTDILDKDICCIYKSADLQNAKDLAEDMQDHESIVAVVRRELVDWEEVPNV